MAVSEQFQSVKLKTDLVPMASQDSLGSKLFYILLLLPFVSATNYFD
jgi:hypothetical protein